MTDFDSAPTKHAASPWRSFAVVSAALMALLALGLEVTDFWRPFSKNILFNIGVGILCLVSGRAVLKSGFLALFQGRFSKISLLVTLSAIGAFALGEPLEAAVVLALFAFGETLEEAGWSATQTAYQSLAQASPTQAELRDGGSKALDEVQVGDVLVLRTGARLGVDGIVVSGSGLLDESTLTGEFLPRAKTTGDTVLSGTQLTNGYLEVRASQRPENSTLARILKLSREATLDKAPFQRFIERFARRYTPTVLMASGFLFLIPVLIGGGHWQHWLKQALTLLVISCPCALVISTPLCLVAALGAAARRGALIRGASFIEVLSKVQILAFDKTRTLTQGHPEVTQVQTLGSLSADEVLACAAGIEQFSEHPLAQGIVQAARARGLLPHSAGEYRSLLGRGAQAQCYVCQDRDHFIGSQSLAIETLSLDDRTQEALRALRAQGQTGVLLWTKTAVEGLIGLRDPLRPDARWSLDRLQKMGLSLAMLTGDTEEPALEVAQSLGIPRVKASLKPEDKARVIREWESSGSVVAMVGDGINDAPALATASVGIAMGSSGNPVALETAQVSLMQERLSLVPELIELSRHTWKTIRFNTGLAVGTKLVVLGAAMWGSSSLTLAVVSDVGLLVFVVLWSLRLLRWKPQQSAPTI